MRCLSVRFRCLVAFCFCWCSSILCDAQQQLEDFGLFGVDGHPDCPCLTNLDYFPMTDANREFLSTKLSPDFSEFTYGVGCRAHDVESLFCSDVDCSAWFPRPASLCDKTWCSRPWCFIDPLQCGLLKRVSTYFPGSFRYYSYATCGSMDYFTKGNRMSNLEGQFLKVGFNSNSGGWMGSYSLDGEHFGKPIEKWSGPVVDFVKDTAFYGGFMIEMTDPPESLRNKSNAFFDSTSSFDFCVYATALGYLDMCVATYTVTNDRASVTDFMLLEPSAIYLIADPKYEGLTRWQGFRASAWKVFAPFTVGTWLFIIFFVVPVFAFLTVVHEYGQRGSTMPSEQKVIVTKADRTQELVMKAVPVWSTFCSSLHHMFLAIFLWAWYQPVVTLGGKLNLLGISFFILTTVVAYTANLAAVFGSEEQMAGIRSLDDAIARNYRFCCERKTTEAIISSSLTPDMFAIDPTELGGDGRPGFECCEARNRVFEMIDPIKAETDPRYCHAALAPVEDLQVLKAAGKFCSLTEVGRSVGEVQTGFPVSERFAPALLSLLIQLSNDGFNLRSVLLSLPQSTCPIEATGEGTTLSIVSLSGIWLMVTLFVLASLIAAVAVRIRHRRGRKTSDSDAPEQATTRSRSVVERQVNKRDQNGNPLDAVFYADDRELLALSMDQLSRDRHFEDNMWRNTLRNGRSDRVLLSSAEFQPIPNDKDYSHDLAFLSPGGPHQGLGRVDEEDEGKSMHESAQLVASQLQFLLDDDSESIELEGESNPERFM